MKGVPIKVEGQVVRRGEGLRVPKVRRKAEAEASRVLERARAEAMCLRKEATQQIEEGRASFEREVSEASARHARDMLAELAKFEDARSAALDEELLSLGHAIACALARSEIAKESELLRGLVRESLQSLRGASWVRIRVHPQDLDSLTGLGLEVVGDGTLKPGDIIAESDIGAVDRRLEAVAKRLLAK